MHRLAIRSAVAGLALVAVGCGSEEVVQEAPLRPVRYEEVEVAGGARTRIFSGVAHAGTESRLSFRVPGTLAAVNVKVGQRVRRGQVLARLDPTDYRLQVEEAAAGLAQAQAALRNGEADYERVRALYENNNAARADLDAARAAAESGRAQVRASANRVELARAQAGYTELRAPVDGTIAEVAVEVNENVGSGTIVMVITAGSKPEVEVAVPEALISDISTGDSVTATFDAHPGQEFAARVTEVGVTASRTATTFPVTVGLVETAGEVRSGMAAEVAFRFAAGEAERILVPALAVGEDRKGRHVFLLESSADGTAQVRRHPVEVGELTAEGLEVVEGLSPGDLLVTAGVRRLKDGQRVRMESPS